MAKPRFSNGAERAVEEFGIPSAIAIAFVGGISIIYGPTEAGFVLIGITALSAVAIASKAKFWNAEYTLAVLIVGAFLVLTVPDILSRLVNPAAETLSTLIVLGLLIKLGEQFLNKL